MSFFVLKLLFLICMLNIYFVTNTVYSLVNLICCFILSASLLLFFGLDYISLIFINVYVGAISILFIFVIMMLNLKPVQSFSPYLYVGMCGIVFIFLSINHYFITYFNFINIDVAQFTIYNIVIKINPIRIVGILLFFDYNFYLILASFILFIAMLGSVVLVFESFRVSKFKGETFNQSSKIYFRSFFFVKQNVIKE